MGGAEAFDILIVGAGISGIDAAFHVQKRLPGKSFAILEARERIGGTWDLFRYPGVRSDSDMYTLGFPFRPWRGDKSIVDGPSIKAYVEETAREFGIEPRIRFRHRVGRAEWSSDEARWTLHADTPDGPRVLCCRHLFLASGYYDYERGHRPRWPGEERFEGRIVHPQQWPHELDVAGRRVAVIGSGATAVTLVPALARDAAHVAMVQRSPSYVVSRPSSDRLAAWLQRRLPARLADKAVRWKNVLLGIHFFNRARKRPARVRRAILDLAAKDLPEGYDVERHFGPHYDPWDQRVCLVPDGDLFAGIAEGRIEMVTDSIERFTPSGLRLASGRELEADLVVAATGLTMKLLGGIALRVDGLPVDPGDRLAYKGMMLSEVPNLTLAFGYTNASWTLKSDLTARWFCRLVRHMDRNGHRIAVPAAPAGVERHPLIDFSSGYVKRAEAALPKQGTKPPWRVHQNYVRDLAALRFGRIDDEALEFRGGS